jgi:hypothetical protein
VVTHSPRLHLPKPRKHEDHEKQPAQDQELQERKRLRDLRGVRVFVIDGRSVSQ